MRADTEIMRSVQRIVAVFESFSRNKTSLRLQDIADRIQLPKSTAFRILRSLELAGYLVRLDDQRYCLSFRFTRLSGLVQSTLDIRTISRTVMVTLGEKTKETVALYTTHGRDRVCIDSIASGSSPLRLVLQPGEHIPLQLGSASKTLLAHMSTAELTSILPSVVRAAKRTQEQLRAEFAQIRRQGYAVSHGERLVGLSAISAPIWDANEEARYCLTISGPSIRVQKQETEFVKLVMRSAAEISRQNGSDSSVMPNAGASR